MRSALAPLVARAAFRLALLAALLAAGGCSEDEMPATGLTPQGYGLIEGRVTGPDGPMKSRVGIESVRTHESQGTIYYTQIEVDSTGWFRHVVPYGEYTVAVRIDGGTRVPYCTGYRSNGYVGDTLGVFVGSERLRLDFPLGGTRVTIPVPDGWEGEPPSIELRFPRTAPCRLSYSETAVQEGGRYVAILDGLPAGEYEVSARFAYQDMLLPFGTAEPGTHLVALHPGERAELEYTVPPPTTFRGRVTGCWREMVERTGCGDQPDIGVQVAATGATVFYEETDELGEYRFQAFVADSVCLRYYVLSQGGWYGGRDREHATRFGARPGEEFVFPDIVAGGLFLRPHWPGGITPDEPNLTIDVHDAFGEPVTGGYFGFCDGAVAQGVLPISSLQPGTYYLAIEGYDCRGPWINVWYPDAPTMESSIPIVIDPAGDLVELDWEIITGGSISWTPAWVGEGVVTRCYSRLHPATDSTAVICGPQSHELGTRAAYQGLTDGDYILEATLLVDGRWRRRWYPDVTRFEDAVAVEVRDHAAIDLGVWGMPR